NPAGIDRNVWPYREDIAMVYRRRCDGGGNLPLLQEARAIVGRLDCDLLRNFDGNNFHRQFAILLVVHRYVFSASVVVEDGSLAENILDSARRYSRLFTDVA